MRCVTSMKIGKRYQERFWEASTDTTRRPCRDRQDRVKFPFRQTCPTKFSLERLSIQRYAACPRQNHRICIYTYSAPMRTTWKEIPPVPTSQEFLDVVLSRTQRRLPTQIRSGFKISRIRNFYTRKVKYTQETFTEKLLLILG